jgi:hypothetical protein
VELCPEQCNLASMGLRTLLLTMLGQVLRDEPIGSWSGRGAGASMTVGSWKPPTKSVSAA